MKNGKFLWPQAAGIVAFALALLFTACPDPVRNNGNNEVNVDKAGLNSAITEAEAAKSGVSSSANGAEVNAGHKWVTPTVLTTFDAAINNAKGVRNNASASQTQVDSAASTLKSAITVFKAAIRTKAQQAQTNTSALTAKIAEAENAKTSVIVAGSAAEAASGAAWANTAQVAALQTAIDTATNALTAATQTEVDDAVSDLNTALTTFTGAVSSNGTGTQTQDFTQEQFDALILSASAATAGVTVAVDGDDIPPSVYWVPQADLDTLNNAISAAGSTVDDTAYQTLLSALATFNNAKQLGSTPNIADLQTAIQSADSAKADVVIAATSAGAPGGSAWVTQAQWDALDTPYNTAVAAYNNADATKNAVAGVTSALSTAVGVFNSTISSNGPGTQPNGLTITGLGAIYKNGTSVHVGVLPGKEFDPSSAPENYVQGTVTGGSLTISLPALENGPYYSGFSIEGAIVFISKTTAAFSGGTVSLAYPADFEPYVWSMNMGDMGIPQTMTVNEAIAGMAGDLPGSPTTYTAWKSAMLQVIGGILGEEYASTSFLDISLYKNAACTLEFSGTDTVGPATDIYTKYSLTAIMGGGGDPPGTVGHITGTINPTNLRGGEKVHIHAEYNDGDPVYDLEYRYDRVKDDGSFSIPVTQTFLTALQTSGSLSLHFRLLVGSPNGENGFGIDIESPMQVTSSQLSGGNTLNVSLGTVNMAHVILSGTISVTYNGYTVPCVDIAPRFEKEYGYGTRLTAPGPNTAWTIYLPAFASPTDVEIYVFGYDSNENELFRREGAATVSGVSTADRTVPAINLGNISQY